MSQAQNRSFLLLRLLSARLRFWLLKGNEIRKTVKGRRELARLDDRMLADIGISRAQAEAEAGRKFWDIAPKNLNADE